MDLFIRGVDPMVVKVFDEDAKARNVSRNEYLKSLLTSITSNYLMRDEKREKNNVLSKVADGLEITHDRVENLEAMFERLYLLTILNSGMSLEEADHMIDSMIRKENE